MQKPDLFTLVAASEALANGTPMKDVLEATGLNYSQAWYFHTRRQLEAEGATQPFSAEAVVELRDAGESWGLIAVRLGVAESQVRRSFAATTANRSQGLRIGKGGRWFTGEAGQPFYAETLKRTGTTIPVGAPISVAREVLAPAQNSLVKKDTAELRRIAKGLGIALGKKTNAQLAIAIRKATVGAK